MRKIIRFIIAALLIFIGILVAVDLYTSNHIIRGFFTDKGVVVTNSTGNIFNYDNGGKYTVGDGNVDAKSIKHIEINWVSGEISFETAPSNQISFEEKNSSATSDDDKLHWYQDVDTLYLQWSKSGFKSFAKSKNLSIKLPANLKLDSLSINAVSADVIGSNLNAKEIYSNTVSGKVKFKKAQFDTIEAISVSGDYILEVISKPSSIQFEGVSGSLDLTLPKDTGFTVDISSISGDIKTKVPTTGDKKHQTAGDGAVKISFQSVSADVSITY